MEPKQQLYRLSPDAQAIIQKRVGSPSSDGGPRQPSPSMVLNSIVLRYQAIMDISTAKLYPKFTEEELDAILKWIECQPKAHQSAVRLDAIDHNEAMVKLISDGSAICEQRVLDTYKRRSLLRIISRNLRSIELFAIADLVALRLSKNGA